MAAGVTTVAWCPMPEADPVTVVLPHRPFDELPGKARKWHRFFANVYATGFRF